MAKTIGQLTQTTTIAGGDEFVIEQSGQTKRVAASVVRGDIVDANIKSDAAIAFSKLAALDDGNILVGNGSNVATKVAVTGDVTISNAGVTALARPYTLATAQASTSGTSIDFTGIPSWAKRITLMLNGVSTSGTSNLIIQLGTSGGLQASSYAGSALVSQAAIVGNAAFSTGFLVDSTTTAADVRSGVVSINLVGSNVWVAAGNVSLTNAARTSLFSGSIGLSGTLTQLRVTTVGGTDTFDAGTINISYEG